MKQKFDNKPDDLMARAASLGNAYGVDKIDEILELQYRVGVLQRLDKIIELLESK